MRKFVHLCVYQCRPCYPSGTKALKIYRLTQLFWLCCVRVVNMSNHARIWCFFWSLWSAWIRQTPSLVRVGETGLWLVWWHFLRMLYVAGKRSTGQTAFVVESSQHENTCPKMPCCLVWIAHGSLTFCTWQALRRIRPKHHYFVHMLDHMVAASYQPTSGFKFPGWRSHESHEISWKGMSSSYGQNKMGQ